MNNIFRIQLLALTIAVSFYIAYAFASSNSDMPSIGGKAQMSSADEVFPIRIGFQQVTPSKIKGITFDLQGLAGV